MRKTIRDYTNFPIGEIETFANGDQQGFDRFGRPCGSYKKSSDMTFDRFNWPFARGNNLIALIYEAEATNSNTKR